MLDPFATGGRASSMRAVGPGASMSTMLVHPFEGACPSMNSPVQHDFSKGVAFIRGQYVPIAEAAIPITDWGFLRSDATYDVVTVWDGAFFRLDAHLERFIRSCERFRLDPGLTPEQIVAVLTECVRKSGL